MSVVLSSFGFSICFFFLLLLFRSSVETHSKVDGVAFSKHYVSVDEQFSSDLLSNG